MGSRFVSKAARFKPGVAYTGASLGIFDPGKMAESILGEVNFGELMAYCWRRFGPPNTGSDEYKGLADWIITTPMKGLFLLVTIRPHATDLLFGYRIEKELNSLLYRIQTAQETERRERWLSWCVETKGEEPPLWGRDVEGNPWRYGTPEYAERHARSELYEAEFATSAAATAPSSLDLSLLVSAELALKSAIGDLKRPVFVRDVEINALGESAKSKGSVGYFHAAGYFTPPYLLDDPNAWVDLLGAIRAFGQGKAGVRRAVQALREAAPRKRGNKLIGGSA